MSPTPQPAEHAAQVRDRYAWMHLLVDFAAAFLFVAGSILFFYPSHEIAATWCFLVGSIFFGFKPTIRLVSRLHQARILGRLEGEVEHAVAGL
jgi:YrhK-like protein